MRIAKFKNGESVQFDRMVDNGDDVLFFRGAIGLVHAQHKTNIIEITDDNDIQTERGEAEASSQSGTDAGGAAGALPEG